MESSPSRGPFQSFAFTDLKSGFLVFLIALPLCLGIAMASGFPPVAGILTAIVGGVVVSFIGSAELTIKGPAAGLIVIALGAVMELGQGDPIAGYKRALAVGVVAALCQIGLAFFRTATVGIAMSPSVVHGMLAAIGVIIIANQTHAVFGVVPEPGEPLHLLAQIPHSLMTANPEILAIGGVSLLILFGWPLIRASWAKSVPAALVVLAVTIPLEMAFGVGEAHPYEFLGHAYTVGPQYLVSLPGSLVDAINLPDFSMITSAASIKYIVMFALVGTIESTLSVLAVDSMDPAKDPSDLNRDLLSVGIGNLVCALIGGLPMISEIVRSRANVDARAQSRWSNFFHGAFLLLFVALAPGFLQLIPLAALAAMLVYTGSRLASPAEIRHAHSVGRDQLALFLTTLIVTLTTDLLVGVGVGLALKVLLHWVRGASPLDLFSTRVEAESDSENGLALRVVGVAAFTTLLELRRHLSSIAPGIRRIVVDLHDARLVDHTFLSRLDAMAAEVAVDDFSIVGLESMNARSAHPHATRTRRAE